MQSNVPAEVGQVCYNIRVTASDILQDTRVRHVRELKAEVARLKAELAAAQAANAQWEHHFALTVLAARDADRLPSEGRILALDGWNIVFNTRFKDHKREFVAFVRDYAAAHAADFVWLVFDGDDAQAHEDGNLRISYTGGRGAHRADRLITDYVRLQRLVGRAGRVTVVTGDKDFRQQVAQLGATVVAAHDFVARPPAPQDALTPSAV